MADYLANIYATEKDKVNCTFFNKVGGCRHGENCSRRHNKPVISETIILANMYDGMGISAASTDAARLRDHFDNFYIDLFIGLAEYGEIVDYMVCSNLCDHLRGNVYVKYADEDSAERAVKALNNRFYGGKPILYVDFSPITDFSNASCKQNEEGYCKYGQYCNFVHVGLPSNDIRAKLFNSQALTIKTKREKAEAEERQAHRSEDRHRSSRHRHRDRASRSRSPRRRSRSGSRSRHDRERKSKHDRSERSERSERTDRAERSERTERSERSDRERRHHRRSRDEEDGAASADKEYRGKRVKHTDAPDAASAK